MIFPFQIRFERVVNIDINKIGAENVLNFIKEYVLVDEKEKNAIKKVVITRDSISFKSPFINWGRGFSDFEFVYKAELNISTENGIPTFSYKYIIGNGIYYFLGIISFISLLEIMTSKSSITNIPSSILYFVFGFVIIMWLAALVRHYFLFKRIVKKVEDKWPRY